MSASRYGFVRGQAWPRFTLALRGRGVLGTYGHSRTAHIPRRGTSWRAARTFAAMGERVIRMDLGDDTEPLFIDIPARVVAGISIRQSFRRAGNRCIGVDAPHPETQSWQPAQERSQSYGSFRPPCGTSTPKKPGKNSIQSYTTS